MEADSTTYEVSKTGDFDDYPLLPFPVLPRNLEFYTNFVHEKSLEGRGQPLVDWLKEFGLVPDTMQCPTRDPECIMVYRAARVVDRVQWVCKNCRKRLAVRTGTFFYKIQCSIAQIMHLILAWCEDADYVTTVQHLGLKPQIVTTIYDRLDEMAMKEQSKLCLGGEGSVVLAEIYPDCLNRLSPDTTDQPHVHRVLMLADTNHISTRYWLHVIKGHTKKIENNAVLDQKELMLEVTEVVSKVVLPGSEIVVGSYVPGIEGATTFHTLSQHCTPDMQRFLSQRLWRQALLLCGAARELCTGVNCGDTCAANMQRYFNTSLYRLRFGDGFYEHTLRLIAEQYPKNNEALA